MKTQLLGEVILTDNMIAHLHGRPGTPTNKLFKMSADGLKKELEKRERLLETMVTEGRVEQ